MKQKLLSFFLALFLLLGAAYAQERTIRGKVTSSTGEALPAVSVIITGTTNGTQTNAEGNFNLNVPEGAASITVSYIGYAKQVINLTSSTTYNIVLSEDAAQLNEVVVTALGISRQKKSLGYSVQEIKGEDVSQTKQTNFVNGLNGKVAGVQVVGGSGNMGGSAKISIRGISSITGNNNPLFVVDGIPMDNSNFAPISATTGKPGANQARGAGGYDYGNTIQDINPDDIESYSVLKGAAATALYGSRALNGVILITTKKGSKKKGLGVSYNFNAQMDKVYKLPDYQNQYGGGAWDDKIGGPQPFKKLYTANGTYDDGDGKGRYDLLVDYARDESWGPKFDPNVLVRHYWSFEGDETGVSAPWVAHPNNVRDFFETGMTYTNNVALDGANDQGSFRVAYTNLSQNFILPNSKFEKNNISFNGNYNFSPRLHADLSANYAGTKATGRPGTGYDGANVMQQFNNFGQRSWDIEHMRNYENPDGSQRTWNRVSYDDPRANYTDNPYWTRYKNYQNDGRDRFYGVFGLTYDITDELKVSAKAMTDFYTDIRQERIAFGSNAVPFYSHYERFNKEENFEARISYNKTFNDFSVNAMAGVNRRENQYRINGGQTVGGLNVKDFFNLRNSTSPALLIEQLFQNRMNSVFASASFGYKEFIYLDLTGRNDWSSTLPANNNSFFYPAASASFVFSELGSMRDSGWLNFGKLRFGAAKVGNDTDPYRLLNIFEPDQSIGDNPSYTRPLQLNNPNLKPETAVEYEAGLEMRMFDNRFGFDFSAYHKTAKDQIIPLAISPTSGYTSRIINAGKMQNKGLELAIYGTPIKTSGGFTWDATFNIARNVNKLIELYTDPVTGERVTNLTIGTAPFVATINAEEGESYGSIMGSNFVYDDNGNKVVLPNGLYKVSNGVEKIGSILPDFTGGFMNTFSYKAFSLGVNFDFQSGGDVFSITNLFGKSSGLFEETAANGIRENGIIVPGVKEDGTPNDVTIDAYTHFNANGGQRIAAENVYDASYIYLREVNLGYNLPKSFVERLRLQSVRVALTGRNLWLMKSNIPHVDPSAMALSTGNLQGIEGVSMPSTRTFGFNLNVTF